MSQFFEPDDDNRESAESHVYFRITTGGQLVDDYQRQLWFWLDQPEKVEDQNKIQSIFPPKVGQETSLYLRQQQEQSEPTHSVTSTGHETEMQIAGEDLEIFEDENPNEPNDTIKANRRRDPHDISQNISSKLRTLVSKLMSRGQPKEWKKLIRDSYDKFLKKSQVCNSQVVLLFAYLFLAKNGIAPTIYTLMKSQLLKYLENKRLQARKKEDEAMRKGLQIKLRANMNLANYLFELKGRLCIDFKVVQDICSPLFTGRQASRIEAPLTKASKMQEEIKRTMRNGFLNGNRPSDIQTSNTSTGCQVELE